MAKRATNSEPYRPVKASLVADVMGVVVKGASSAAAEAPTPELEPEPPRFANGGVVSTPQQDRQAATRSAVRTPEPHSELEPARHPSFDPGQRLSREKRYLLTVDEEDRVEDLVRSLARELRTPIKLSHLVRAALALITRSQNEMLNQARVAERIERPSNGDTPGLLRFEGEVSKLLDSALRMTKPL